MNRRIGRRGLLGGAAAVIGTAVAVAAGRVLPGWIGGADGDRSAVTLGPVPPDLPGRQHAWEQVLARDEHGNSVAPRFHRLLLFEVAGEPRPAMARAVEAALRTLERRFPWGPDGLLLTLGWSSSYFERIGVASPLPPPGRLTSFETPELDGYDACLHLACDDEQRLERVEGALVRGEPLDSGEGPLDLSGALIWRETRTGFVGAGLPAARQRVGGIPPGDPVPPEAPLFMGFRSGFRRNQASEDDVTIPEGPLAGGTTMHVSRMRLRLESWYGLLDEAGRVARMFAPQLTSEEVAGLTDEAQTFAESIEETAREHGVVGHLQATVLARRDGRPIILRRDFDTTDGGEAGLHFVSLHRSIDDFVATRRAMNAAEMPFVHPAIGPRTNNGIKEFMFVVNRANYIIPPRSQRAFPLLPGREAALA